MASSVTLTNLLTKIRNRGELRTTGLFTDGELTEYINGSIAHLYDLISEADESLFFTSSTISVVSGTDNYSLPATYYRLLGVDVAYPQAASGRVALERYNFRERHFYQLASPVQPYETRYEVRGGKLWLYPSPTWSGTIYLGFIATAPSLTTGSDTWDTINLWDEWVLLDVLVKCAGKRREDAQLWMARQEKVEARILANCKQDLARPRAVVSLDDVVPPNRIRLPGTRLV